MRSKNYSVVILLRYGGLQHDWVIHQLEGFIEMDSEAKTFAARAVAMRARQILVSLSNAPVPQSLMSQEAQKD